MLNKSIRIAFLGPKGSYSHIASIKYANYRSNQIIEYSCKSFSDIFNVVECRYAEYGVLPIENSNSGLINEVCDLLLKTQLKLVGDITIPIEHYILVNDITSIKQIKIIYSHPQPVQQCSKFLNDFSKWKIIFCESSSVAIKTVAHLKKPDIAALGSIQGGRFYGLQPLLLPQKMITNCHINKTRFIILKNTDLLIINTTIFEKIMISISIDRKLKKLYSILKILHFYNIKINFLRLRTLFYHSTENIIIVEITAALYHPYTQKALINIQKISYSLKILGCYSSIPINKNNLLIRKN